MYVKSAIMHIFCPKKGNFIANLNYEFSSLNGVTLKKFLVRGSMTTGGQDPKICLFNMRPVG